MAGRKKKAPKKKAVKKKAPRKKTVGKKVPKKKATKKPRGRKLGSKWTKRQLDILHECWKSTSTRKACLEKVAEKLPEMPPPAAWALVRRLSKRERAWILTAQQKEREKEQKRRAKERAKEQRAQRRAEREKAKARRDRRGDIRDRLRDKHMKRVAAEIGSDFFFCPDVQQQVCVLSCIFRVFSPPSKYGFSHGGPCSTCRRMDKHMPVLESILKEKRSDAKQKPGRDPAGTHGREAEK
jgi:hypothetical protein